VKTTTQTVFCYLDKLRESGATNMFGAAPYLEKVFHFDKQIARNYLRAWMDTFDSTKEFKVRADEADRKGII
jgi:hypothetical protein